MGERFSTAGALNGNAKLTTAQVIQIRERYARRAQPGKRVTMAQLAKEYDVHAFTIRRILHRLIWQHI